MSLITKASREVNLAWDDPGDPLPSYDIQYRGHPGPVNWTPSSPKSPPARASGKISATVSGLNCPYTYDFRVRGRNGTAIGPYSAVHYGVVTIGLRGTDGDDTLSGDGMADCIFGLGGGDSLNGLGGADVLNGGDGNDLLTGGAGNDELYGGDGHDVMNGGDGNDLLMGGEGFDTLNGGAGNDQLHGGGGVRGVAGLETLDGGAGDDFLIAGAGNSHLVGGAGADRMNGSMGQQIAFYSLSDVGVTVDLETGRGRSGHAEGDTLVGIENVVGSRFDDVLTGNYAANALAGGDGNDNISGGRGGDELEGEDGDDKLNGGGGNDTLRGEAGDDAFYFYEDFGNDTISDYSLGASQADSEKIYLCMGDGTNLATHAGADSGSDRVITVTFDGATAGTITLKGITSGSANFANLNVMAAAADSAECAP